MKCYTKSCDRRCPDCLVEMSSNTTPEIRVLTKKFEHQYFNIFINFHQIFILFQTANDRPVFNFYYVYIILSFTHEVILQSNQSPL